MPDGLADLARDVRRRADGMAGHLVELDSVGLSQADVDAGHALAVRLETLDAEQAALRAAFRAKTIELDAAMRGARQWRGRMGRLIKMGLESDPALWAEFGITARR